MKLSVVIPVYKNRMTLTPLFEKLKSVLTAAGYSFDVIFVNDACPEGSGEELSRLAGVESNIRIFEMPVNQGQHAALLRGISEATGDVIVTMDADLQDDPEMIPLLLKRMDASVDVVFAAKQGHYQSKQRLLTSRLFKILLVVMTGGRLPARTSLFLSLSRQAAARLMQYGHLRPHLIVMMGLLRFRTASMPFHRPRRPDGTSSYSSRARLKSAWHAGATMLRYHFDFLFRRSA